MDHSKMDHGKMQHGTKPTMGMAGHDHHAMMIADFKKRFYVVLILTVPIMLLSTMIQRFIGVDLAIRWFHLYFICFINHRIYLWRMAFFKRIGR